jgi:DNA-binding protein
MAGTKRKTTIPKAPVQRILMDAGAKRVSAGAIDAFTALLEEMAAEVGEQAVRIAKHSGRKTVQAGDIKLAVKM